MTKILGIERLDETIVHTGHGDNWHMTWAADDKQYTALCDGDGFSVEGDPLRFNNSRVYAVRGDPPDHRFEYLPGYPQLDLGRGLYNFGILALDGTLYSFLSRMAVTPDRDYGMAFIGARLIVSPDLGRTWQNADGSPCTFPQATDAEHEAELFFHEEGDAFSLLTMVQMGRGYAHNIDGFAYIAAPNGNEPHTMAELVLCRTPRDRIAERSAYQFFVARDAEGAAQWSRDIRDRQPVITFPDGWVNRQMHPYAWHPSIIYNRPLGVYMMANWGIGVADDDMWFGKPSYLGFWTAPQPWGPWTQVHEETEWVVSGDMKGRLYQPQIAPKWIAEDGRSFWLVYTDFQNAGKTPGYEFNCQRVRILT